MVTFIIVKIILDFNKKIIFISCVVTLQDLTFFVFTA
jgi:hypothetical protein